MFQIVQISRLRIKTDGDGIRSLIITHGCPLRCRYCINPLSWNGGAKRKDVDARQLYQEIMLDRPYFMATGGGITFGGGEPLQYAADIQEFRELCGGQFTLFAETSLNVPMENVVIAAECIDHFFVDIKTTDSDIYRGYTGGDLERALENLMWLLDKVGTDRITVRIPVIPDFTTAREQTVSKEFLAQMGIKHFELFTYTVRDKER